MPENSSSWLVAYKDYILAALAGIAVAVAGWFDMRRRVLNNQDSIIKIGKSIDSHLNDHRAVGYITSVQHDRMQTDCQKLWKSEFGHIRETLESIKSDIRELRKDGSK